MYGVNWDVWSVKCLPFVLPAQNCRSLLLICKPEFFSLLCIPVWTAATWLTKAVNHNVSSRAQRNTKYVIAQSQIHKCLERYAKDAWKGSFWWKSAKCQLGAGGVLEDIEKVMGIREAFVTHLKKIILSYFLTMSRD